MLIVSYMLFRRHTTFTLSYCLIVWIVLWKSLLAYKVSRCFNSLLKYCVICFQSFFKVSMSCFWAEEWAHSLHQTMGGDMAEISLKSTLSCVCLASSGWYVQGKILSTVILVSKETCFDSCVWELPTNAPSLGELLVAWCLRVQQVIRSRTAQIVPPGHHGQSQVVTEKDDQFVCGYCYVAAVAACYLFSAA